MTHNSSTDEVNKTADAEAHERFRHLILKLPIENLRDEPILCGVKNLAFPTFLPDGTREAMFLVSKQDLGNGVQDSHWHLIVIAESFPGVDGKTLVHVPRIQILIPRGRRDMTVEQWEASLLDALDENCRTPNNSVLSSEWEANDVIHKLGELDMDLESELDLYGFRIEKESIEDGDRYIVSKLLTHGAPSELVADCCTHKAQLTWIEIVHRLLQNLQQRQLGAVSASGGVADGN
jgi:hypothetical protein